MELQDLKKWNKSNDQRQDSSNAFDSRNQLLTCRNRDGERWPSISL